MENQKNMTTILQENRYILMKQITEICSQGPIDGASGLVRVVVWRVYDADPVLWRYMTSLGHNEVTHWDIKHMAAYDLWHCLTNL